jgi:hypothetical protein
MQKKIYLKFDFFYVLFVVFSLFLVFKTGPINFPDSQGYLNMDIYRSLGYPSFITFHKWLFGSKYLSLLLFSQFSLTTFSIFYLKNKIAYHLKLSQWSSLLVFLLLFVPVFYEIKVINAILSEALAYPLYLLLIANLLEFITKKHFKNIIYSSLLLLILIQVRGQFMFVVIVLILAILISKTGNSYNKKHWISIITFVTIPFLSIGIDVAFHKIKHHKATTTPWTGIQTASLPFYVSNKDDYKVLDTKIQQDYFKYIYSYLEKKKLLLSQFSEDSLSEIDFYFANYVYIANATLGNDGETFFKDKYPFDELVIVNDKMAASITIPLLKNNFLNWSKYYILNIIKGIGSAKYLIITLFLMFFSFMKFRTKETINAKFIFIGTLLILGNVTLVAIAEPTISRYLFYNNWILPAIIMLLFQLSFYKKTDE